MRTDGSLAGIRVVEFDALGPVRHAGMLLADMGADVVSVAPRDADTPDADDMVRRGRRIVAADLKNVADVQAIVTLIECADVVVEGYRPQVMERLGLGPEQFAAKHPRLIYARITGWGQHGPLAQQAGHDINFIALSGALHGIGAAGNPPAIPSNLLGDYAAGSLYLVCGVLAALHERSRSGLGQTVDAAIFDGLMSLMSPQFSLARRGLASDLRGTNLLDGGAPHYNIYETLDGRYVSVGALERKFRVRLCKLLGLPETFVEEMVDRDRWGACGQRMAAIFRTRTLAAWCERFAGEDVCFAPVLTPQEALVHPHAHARKASVLKGGALQTAPSPRLGRTPSGIRPFQRADLLGMLREWQAPD